GLVVAREQVSVAEARVKVAQQDLDNCTVRAPFGGIVVSKDAQRGEMVPPVSAGAGFTRTGIATIVDMSSLEIEVDVNESYIARAKAGQAGAAVLDAYPHWQIPAKVRTVSPTAERQRARGDRGPVRRRTDRDDGSERAARRPARSREAVRRVDGQDRWSGRRGEQPDPGARTRQDVSAGRRRDPRAPGVEPRRRRG